MSRYVDALKAAQPLRAEAEAETAARRDEEAARRGHAVAKERTHFEARSSRCSAR